MLEQLEGRWTMTYKCRGNGKVIPVYRSKAQAGKLDDAILTDREVEAASVRSCYEK